METFPRRTDPGEPILGEPGPGEPNPVETNPLKTSPIESTELSYIMNQTSTMLYTDCWTFWPHLMEVSKYLNPARRRLVFWNSFRFHDACEGGGGGIAGLQDGVG